MLTLPSSVRIYLTAGAVDLHAAALHAGSSHGIPRALRLQAQKECEAFVLDHIARRESFAVETTLRSHAAIEQARQARSAGFETRMIFICAGNVTVRSLAS